jgi:ABC-type phosphate transport system substrate-binding protein
MLRAQPRTFVTSVHQDKLPMYGPSLPIRPSQIPSQELSMEQETLAEFRLMPAPAGVASGLNATPYSIGYAEVSYATGKLRSALPTKW